MLVVEKACRPRTLKRDYYWVRGLVKVALNGNFHEMVIPIRRISSSGGPRILVLVGFLICVVEVAPSMLALDHLLCPLCLQTDLRYVYGRYTASPQVLLQS